MATRVIVATALLLMAAHAEAANLKSRQLSATGQKDKFFFRLDGNGHRTNCNCVTENGCFLCTSCRTCPSGCVLDVNGIDECFRCEGEGFNPTHNHNSQSCQRKRTCSPGQYVTSNGSRSADRRCATCPSGKTSSSNNAGGCTEINSATTANHQRCRARGDKGASAVDIRSPGNGFTCRCSKGWFDAGSVCSDVNGCSSHTNCKKSGDSRASCKDVAAPATGYTCACSAGFAESGGSCKDINGCSGNPCNDAGDSGSRCVDRKAPATGNTCQCSKGFQSSSSGDKMICIDVDGCKGDPCSAGLSAADIKLADAKCEDRQAPGTGYSCTCSAAFKFDQERGRCVRRDYCKELGRQRNRVCGAGGTCVNGPDSYSCKCATGYVLDTNGPAVCVDKDDCAGGNTCRAAGDSKAGCDDVKAPDTGFMCKCSKGFKDTGGRKCEDIDGCEGDPCKTQGDAGATCKDVAAPADKSTNTCACSKGYVSTSGGGPETCVDKNACEGNPCAQGADKDAQCADAAAPAEGYQCKCSEGFEEKDGKCVDADGCKKNDCKANDKAATCADVEAPGIGYTCKCSTGFEVHAEGKAGKETCVDAKGCEGNTCAAGSDKEAKCHDVKAPGTGFSCDCSTGWADKAGKCEDEDGCEEHTCNDGGDKGATCTDAAAPSEGFVCKCSAGFALGADKMSCADEDGCKDHTCNSKGDAAAKCNDVPAPGSGFTCGCSEGFKEDNGACVDINACDKKPCTAKGDKDATCADEKAPSLGNTCKCTAGFESSDSGKGLTTCVDIAGCKGNPCSAKGDEGAKCTDAAAPKTGYSCECSSDFVFVNGDCEKKNDCMESAEKAIDTIKHSVDESNEIVEKEGKNWEDQANKCKPDQGPVDAAKKKLEEAEDDLKAAKKKLDEAENAKVDSCKAGLSLGELEKLMKNDAFPSQLGPNGAFPDAYKAVEEAKKEADAAPKVVEKMEELVKAEEAASQEAFEQCKCDALEGFEKAVKSAREAHDARMEERKNTLLRERKTICYAGNVEEKMDTCENLELSQEDLKSLEFVAPPKPSVEFNCPRPDGTVTAGPVITEPPVTEAPEGPPKEGIHRVTVNCDFAREPCRVWVDEDGRSCACKSVTKDNGFCEVGGKGACTLKA